MMDPLSDNIFIPAGILIIAFLLIFALLWKILCKCGRPVTPPNTPGIPKGTDIDLDNVVLQKVIGYGHFGSVWQGNFQGSSVAVKVFSSELKQWFTKEKDVYILPLMKHSGIVHFLAAGRIGKENVLLLELATEGCLNAFLRRNMCNWRQSVKLAQTLAEGLAYLHTDLQNHGVHKPVVAHGDLSSNNVLVRADGSCALCDFGCSTILQNIRNSQTSEGQHSIAKTNQMGTLRYMAPEILLGCVNLSSDQFLLQADVYSLGLLLWELLMRCSDLFKDSPIPEHMLPYEQELGQNPTRQELIKFVSEEGSRPIIPFLWGNVSQGYSLCEILEDCWDEDEDARLKAPCAANRLASLPSELV